jgi:hypothetical protein
MEIDFRDLEQFGAMRRQEEADAKDRVKKAIATRPAGAFAGTCLRICVKIQAAPCPYSNATPATMDRREPAMFVVAGPPGGGKSSAFPVAAFGSDDFDAGRGAAVLNSGSFREIPQIHRRYRERHLDTAFGDRLRASPRGAGGQLLCEANTALAWCGLGGIEREGGRLQKWSSGSRRGSPTRRSVPRSKSSRAGRTVRLAAAIFESDVWIPATS